MMLDKLCGLAIASVSVFGAAGAQLIEDQHISLPTLFAVGAAVFSATWWISNKFTKIDDTLEYLKVESDKRSRSIEDLRAKIESLPCPICAEESHQRHKHNH